jgi:tetratricopeptide (TPR) repeat protein
VQILSEKELGYLRIEKIGTFYAVRLEKFDDRISAEKFLLTKKGKLPGAIILDAYIIKERIVRSYKTPLLHEGNLTEQKDITTEPKEAKIEVNEKGYHKIGKEITLKSSGEQVEEISALLDKKEYEKALEVTKILIASRPEDPELNGWYGTVLLKTHHAEKAIKYFRKASKLSPDTPDYYNGAGYCLSFLNRFDDAIYEFSKAVMIDPLNIDALTGLGIAYGKTGQKDKAMFFYNKLKNLDRETADKVLKIIENERQ